MLLTWLDTDDLIPVEYEEFAQFLLSRLPPNFYISIPNVNSNLTISTLIKGYNLSSSLTLWLSGKIIVNFLERKCFFSPSSLPALKAAVE